MNINKIEIGDTGQSALDKINTNESNLLTEISTLAQDTVRKSSLSQNTGSATNEAMSQDAVTKKLSQKADQSYVDDKLQGLVYKEPVATKNLLLLGELGWVRLVQDENVLYQCQGGSNWVKTGLTAFPKDVLTKSDVKQAIDQNSTMPVSEDAVQKKFKGFSDALALKDFFKIITEKGFAICDKNGYTSMLISEDGTADLSLSQDVKDQLAPSKLKADYNHIITYGQSLGEGSNGQPLISPVAFSTRAKMFNHGIKTRYAVAPKYASFVPHVEVNNAENGETPAAGAAAEFIRNNKGTQTILSSCCARGGMTLAELAKGTGWYANVIADITNGNRLAKEQGKTYRLTAVLFCHGENDTINGISKDAYKSGVVKLRADIIADAQAITGDSYTDLPFVIYQMAWFPVYGAKMNVAMAQLELGTTVGSGFYIAAPNYYFYHPDKTHCNGYGYYWLGTYLGIALDAVINKGTFTPLLPISHTVNGNEVLVKFSRSDIRFLKPYYADEGIGNHGLSIKSGTTELITSVEIASPNTIKITCSASPASLMLTYGERTIKNFRYGEICDSEARILNIAGADYPMANWCVLFERKLV